MKPLVNRKFVIAVLTVACLMTVLLTVAPIRSGSPSAGEYDPWLDWNDDGKIDMKDIGRIAKAFGTSGQNVSKASPVYDSGWLDLRNETGEYYTLAHNLNLTSLDMIVDARQRTQIWSRTYGGAGIDVAEALVQTGDGGYALAGGTIFSFGSNSVDAYLVKTDASGNLVWNMTYGGIDTEYAYALVQTGDGGYALAGYSDDYVGNLSAYLVKTDASGTMQWNKTYGGTSNDEAYALVQIGDGGYALAGYTESFGAYADAWLVKSESESGLAWIPSFMNSITLVRDEATLWNFVRVQIWKKR